jgi:hypothetical protein
MSADLHREQCSSCACFFPLSIMAAGVSGHGQCHRFPPQIVAVMAATPQGAALVPVAGSPQVTEKDWCAEYRARPFAAANA